MGERPPRPTRGDYVVWRTMTTRWADDDVYGHMNNAVYYEMFDTAVNAHLIEATGVNVRTLPAVGVVAETSCRYFREIGFPAPVEAGLAVERVGTSSVVYRIGLFQGDGDEAAAEGRFVHVYVDNTTGPGNRPVRPLPDAIRAVAEALVPTAPAD
ncbi:acyl-CoA thioesterase [Nocardioides iriomotensis]|uniref:Acyl-CoA thioesterase n=1 Tax=Nocardioides iriomotensis TaxID=715784 RepID=A0A4Q5J1P9_9ACTN|nr:thioesterase family protein [Nocardioides iriomotensis]RYU12324.1 acyl-CoA thioesterase [Nocardioides iriomotensis]